ncbi:hypothetical protein G6F33_010828 [Rhizopus arrhizus]|nr:hypothetical protein G6F24_009904 [Rhizopus arrhizus]KAG0907139.1 hypothetical protein G6F33_010828 [Rhizopus arrhizus]KAG0933272.1 hypothetical protein G6F32_011126 [Rhizopus arrhizus]KAG1285489.1 hypothetical protein G6F66_010399 [Rhizopus arrhizus]
MEQKSKNFQIMPSSGDSKMIIPGVSRDLIKIPSYDKSKDPNDWLQLSWLFKFCIYSPVVFDQEFEDWSTFKEEFIERFDEQKIPPNILFGQLMNIQRHDNENLKKYVDRFNHLQLTYIRTAKRKTSGVDLKDDLLKYILIEGIRPKWLRTIVNQTEPKKLSDAVKIIRDLDDSKENDDAKIEAKMRSEDPYDSDAEASDHKYKQKIEEKWINKNNSKERSSFENTHHQRHLKATKENRPDLEDKLDHLTHRMEQLTLLVEKSGKQSVTSCYNFCKGNFGSHVFWECDQYKPKPRRNNNEQNFLIEITVEETSDYKENLAAEKRNRSGTDSDVRKTRSGKKLKVHDTIPNEERKETPKEMKSSHSHLKSKQTEKTDQSSRKRSSKESKPAKAKERKLQNDTDDEYISYSDNENGILHGSEVNPAEIVRSKVFKCSLEQLGGIKGFKTGLYHELLRKVFEVQMEKEFKVREPLDAKLADKLGLKPNGSSKSSHIMENGGYIVSRGVVEDLIVQVQRVKINVHPSIFESPSYDLLLGSEALELLGVSADYGKRHFCIRGEDGIEPLAVKFTIGKSKIQSVDPVSDSESYDTSVYDSEGSSYESSSADGSSTDAQECFLIMPTASEEETFLNEDQKEETSHTKKIVEILAESVQDSELNEGQKQELLKLLITYIDVHGIDYKDLKQTNLLKLHIDTGENPPIMKRPNRFMSHAELETLKQELETMIKNGQLMPATHAPGKNGTKC